MPNLVDLFLNEEWVRAAARAEEEAKCDVHAGYTLPDAYSLQEPPQVGELDEFETFVGSKKTKSGSGQP